MSPLCQIGMTLAVDFAGVLGVTVPLMSDRELARLELLRDLDRGRLTTATAAQLLARFGVPEIFSQRPFNRLPQHDDRGDRRNTTARQAAEALFAAKPQRVAPSFRKPLRRPARLSANRACSRSPRRPSSRGTNRQRRAPESARHPSSGYRSHPRLAEIRDDVDPGSRDVRGRRRRHRAPSPPTCSGECSPRGRRRIGHFRRQACTLARGCRFDS